MTEHKNEVIRKQREERRVADREKNKLIKDVRIYFSFSQYDKKSLNFYPYSRIYENLFRNFFKRKELKCPQYDHIYIQISNSIEEALDSTVNNTLDPWFETGVSLMDIECYLNSDIDEKKDILFKSICDGMKDIFSIDKLDMNILEQTIGEIKSKGIFQELIHKEIENKTRRFLISYKMVIDNEKLYYDVYFELYDFEKNYKIYFGRLDTIDKVYYWFKYVRFSYENVIIEPSNNLSAQMELKENYTSLKIPFEIFYKVKEREALLESELFSNLRFDRSFDTQKEEKKELGIFRELYNRIFK